MCELLGGSSRFPRSFSRWLAPFRQRGGHTANNPDGWGVAFWADGWAAIEKSPEPGWANRRFLALAERADSPLVIAHVRKARHPPVPGLLNTHPFSHACCGREWVFAHNGLVPVVPGCASACHPGGETDSETAFCRLLAGIAGDYDAIDHGRWISRVAEVAAVIAASGKFNFLLSDGRVLIAYGHDRLHYLDGSPGGEALAVVSTEPITGDDWHAFAPQELRAYRDGILLARHIPGDVADFMQADKVLLS
jgi:glutamine amidotransferase